MATIRKTITVYAGSADKLDPVFMNAAYALGKAIATQGRQLVFGSGKPV